jgi:urease alpha subunit
MDADLPISRPRALVEGCRGLTSDDMVRNTRTGRVVVDAVRGVVTLDGEPVVASPVARVAFSGTYLLG